MTRLCLLLAALCLALAGCGGDDEDDGGDSGERGDRTEQTDTKDEPTTEETDTTPAEAPPDDEDSLAAKEALTDAATAIEACYVDAQDYSKCNTEEVLTEAGVEVSEGLEGAVRIGFSNEEEYHVSYDIETGKRGFQISYSQSTGQIRSCFPGGSPGCAGEPEHLGDW